MAKNKIIVTDPRGNKIRLQKGLCVFKDFPLGKDAYDDLASVIEKPIIMIQMKDEKTYYYRSVGWNITLLVTAVKKNNEWLAETCLLNPDPKMLSALLKEGNQII